MILHLLKDPVSPMALRMLSAQSSPSTSTFMAVMLSPSGTLPDVQNGTIYRVTENASAQSGASISYDRLVALLFEAEKVIAW